MTAVASPLTTAARQVGDRWSLLVVEALLDGPRRFGELQRIVHGIAPNVLSQRLKHLEREGIVVAQPYSGRPRRYAYSLTGAGADLAGALLLLTAWGAAAGDDIGAPAHSACGSALQPTWFCPTCEVAVPDVQADELRYV